MEGDIWCYGIADHRCQSKVNILPHVRLMQLADVPAVREQPGSGGIGEQTVDGDSIVGNVNSNGDQLKLDRSNGNANPDEGVGLWVRRIVPMAVYWTLFRQPPSIRPISATLACSWCSVVSLASFWVSRILSWNWTVSACAEALTR